MNARAETEPAGTEPADSKPGDTEPVDTEPGDSKPVDSKLVDTEPVDTEPGGTEPGGTEPGDTKSVGSKLGDTEPVGSERGETGQVDEPGDTEPVDEPAGADFPPPVPAPRRRRRPTPTAGLVLPAPLVATRDDPPAHHVRAGLDKRLRVLIAREPGVRSGEDMADLHKMRVSVRRMRATLRAARPLLDARWADALRAELGWLGGVLGPVRDLDVLLERLGGELTGLPDDERAAGQVLLDELRARRVRARATMVAALDTPRHQTLVERVADAVRLPLPTPSATAALPTMDDLVRTEAARLQRAVDRAGPDPADQVLHDLRIDVKRVRYVGELALPTLRGTPSGRLLRRLLAAATGLQDHLGAHQDACVAEEQIRLLVGRLSAVGRVEPDGRPGTGDALPGPDLLAVFVAGRIVERERGRADAEREVWRPAWEQVDQLIRVF